ncbi:hypothetical protein FH972_023717 [Carpinus fangiana]|uniref:Uncharacterized protein n=1 Tax=Carpinus fangiana TaxID=176857 RepID=A0A5N6KWD2_9ROSI|nr:hypothetical protein FH972_023717 [Carpinus fangiana]
MQAKRRAAAARERELRNYHQEQQYNRSGSRTSQTFDASTPSEKEPSGPKSDRSMSPNAAMSEDERRELIARQHRALYGNDSQLYLNDASASRTLSQDARVLAATSSPHGSSPLAFDAFGVPSTSSGDSGIPLQAATGQSSTRASSTTPPSGAPKQFAMFDNGPQQGVKCSSPGPAPAQNGSKGGPGNGVAPIGTRPAQAAGKAGNRGPPSAPSPLGFNGVNINERSQSSASNPNNGNGNGNGDKAPGLGWSGSNGPWGSKMQASDKESGMYRGGLGNHECLPARILHGVSKLWRRSIHDGKNSSLWVTVGGALEIGLVSGVVGSLFSNWLAVLCPSRSYKGDALRVMMARTDGVLLFLARLLTGDWGGHGGWHWTWLYLRLSSFLPDERAFECMVLGLYCTVC